MIKSATQKRDKKRVTTYLDKHNIVNLKGFKKYMKGMETVNNRVATWMIEQIKQQFNNNYDTYIQIVQQNPNNKKTISEIIKNQLATALLAKVPEFLPQILGTIEDNIDYDDLEKDLINNFNQTLNLKIEGLPDDFGIDKKKIEFFE